MRSLLTIALAFFSVCMYAIESDTTALSEEFSQEEMMSLYEAYIDSVESTLVYQKGRIDIGNGLASIDVPNGFKFLDAKSANTVLSDLWGNPPSPEGFGSLGMLLPDDMTPMSENVYAIDITYTEDGYVDDEDAKELDYDDMLKQMQEDTENVNEYRASEGYETIELIGWAASPFYDSENKKLHWAKELKFGDSEVHTLNYNIRILGRRGYLELNAIGGMSELLIVEKSIPNILQSVSFNEGNRYADFNPSMDKVAAYGIGGLIAGKMLLKAGLLAKAGLFLAKFWKIIALAFIGLGAGVKRFFFGKKEEEVLPPSVES